MSKRNHDLLDIESMDIFESKWLLDSPWSVEACKMEGIVPHEILHIPREEMA